MSDVNIPPPPEAPHWGPVPSPPRNPWESNLSRLTRNLNSNQFRSNVRSRVQAGLDNQQLFNSFRTAGMGAAVRYALKMPQLSPGAAETYRARVLKNLSQQPGPAPLVGVPSTSGGSANPRQHFYQDADYDDEDGD
jgi:hypothetical protein